MRVCQLIDCTSFGWAIVVIKGSHIDHNLMVDKHELENGRLARKTISF
jgi:hypothetical protein